MLSIGVNVTGLGSWLTFRADIRREIANAPFPWLQDRSLVMQHIDPANNGVHENDFEKRKRIRDELDNKIGPLMAAQNTLIIKSDTIEREVKTNQVEIRVVQNEIKKLDADLKLLKADFRALQRGDKVTRPKVDASKALSVIPH